MNQSKRLFCPQENKRQANSLTCGYGGQRMNEATPTRAAQPACPTCARAQVRPHGPRAQAHNSAHALGPLALRTESVARTGPCSRTCTPHVAEPGTSPAGPIRSPRADQRACFARPTWNSRLNLNGLPNL